jgi:hypothetical protein
MNIVTDDKLLDVRVPYSVTITAPFVWFYDKNGELSEGESISVVIDRGETVRQGIQKVYAEYIKKVGGGEARTYFVEGIAMSASDQVELLLGT